MCQVLSTHNCLLQCSRFNNIEETKFMIFRFMMWASSLHRKKMICRNKQRICPVYECSVRTIYRIHTKGQNFCLVRLIIFSEYAPEDPEDINIYSTINHIVMPIVQQNVADWKKPHAYTNFHKAGIWLRNEISEMLFW